MISAYIIGIGMLIQNEQSELPIGCTFSSVLTLHTFSSWYLFDVPRSEGIYMGSVTKMRMGQFSPPWSKDQPLF